MATSLKAPNLVKALQAWGRLRTFWSGSLPAYYGIILGQGDRIKALKKR